MIAKESSLKLINLNIEGDNHLERVILFLQKEQADVICLQEVLEKDVMMIKRKLAMEGAYEPLLDIKSSNKVRLTPRTKWGILYLTRLPVFKLFAEYYTGSRETLPVYQDNRPNLANRIIFRGEIIKNNQLFRVITTHFTWTPDGKSSLEQHASLDKLLALLEDKGEFILCGDFNAPRGREIWRELAKRYKDNIPSNVKTTIDPNLHRNGALAIVVDGLFSTKGYEVFDVQVIPGISDHMAIVAKIGTTSRDHY